jgi:hypothetical protein
MTEQPIKPSEVTIDRECERRWITQINKELAEPWFGDEVRRVIEVEGKMTNDSQLVRWVQEQYTQAGWIVSAGTPLNAPDKYATLSFTRPYEGKSND